MSRAPTVLFAGGGSGGHISPGLAIAERLIEIAPDAQPIFVCSNRAIDAAMLREAGVEYIAAPATPPSRRPLAACRFLLNFHRSTRLVMKVIRARGVAEAVTLGGFVAPPVVSAARACGVPVTLVNLDAPPGRANRWMARRADRVLSAIELPDMPGFAATVVGMPIRRRSIAPADAATCRVRLGLNPGAPTLLVTGASQGASSINSFITALAAAKPEVFKDWQILHLSGSSADQEVREAYARAGVKATVEPFLHDMGLAWGAADLAVSRAGASSVAEAAHNAVPTLFLPYPYHKDMHQKRNAQPLVDLPRGGDGERGASGGGGGGGAVIEIDRIDPAENVRAVGPVLEVLMSDRARRESMRAMLRRHQPPGAALVIARMLVDRAAARD